MHCYSNDRQREFKWKVGFKVQVRTNLQGVWAPPPLGKWGCVPLRLVKGSTSSPSRELLRPFPPLRPVEQQVSRGLTIARSHAKSAHPYLGTRKRKKDNADQQPLQRKKKKKSRDITLLTKVHIVKATVLQQSCADVSWNIKKAEHRRIDAFKLWFSRVPWIARRSNQSVLKEINPEY